MFILLRRIERWLHQHLFKVGWLSTHDYQTTTILYYTFFMPGVILHEVVYYLAAGIFNVRAERNIKWPDKQEIGELKLNFVKIAPRTSAFRKAIVTSMPLLVGLIVIWAVSNYIFDITAVVQRMSSGELRDVVAAFNLLIGAPLFWLWIYIIFTIANTMFPTIPKDLQGWRSVLIGLAVVALALFLVGIGGALFEVLQTPLSQVISVLQATFILIMGVDLLMVLILGTIEYTIERITGHSATFRGNRMYTMTREEAIVERENEREKERKKLERDIKRKATVDNSPISIYTMAFSVPGAPGDIPVTQLEILDIPQVETKEDIEESVPAVSMPSFGGLAEGKKEEKPLTEEQKQQRDAIAARINLPERRPSAPKIVKTTDEELTKPAGSSRPTMSPASSNNEKERVASSRFGIGSPSETKSSEQTDDMKPESTGSSHFSRSTNQPVTTPTGDEKTDDNIQEKDTTSSAPFSVQPPSKPIDEIDKKESTISSGFDTRSREKSLPSKEDDTISEKDIPQETDETIRVVGRPASPSLLDEEETDDNSLLRRGRGDDAVANLFGELDSSDDEPEKPLSSRGTSQFGNRFGKLSDGDENKEASSRFGTSRFGRTSSISKDDDKGDESSRSRSTSRFGSGSFLSKPVSSEDDKNDDSEKSVSSLGNYKPSKPINTRFGSSRPAPKPVSSVNDDEDDLVEDEDEIIYEDIDDEYFDYDDDEYIDYDDDD